MTKLLSHLVSSFVVTMLLLADRTTARLTGAVSKSDQPPDRQLLFWQGNDGELCFTVPFVDISSVLGPCDQCRSKKATWWHGSNPGLKCGTEPANWPDQAVCTAGVSCHLCQNGYHHEGVLAMCGPDRSCKPAGEYVTWFGAHLCCNGHTVQWWGAIQCN